MSAYATALLESDKTTLVNRILALESELAEARGQLAGDLPCSGCEALDTATADLLRVRGERDRLRDPTSFDQLVQDVMDNPNAAHAATINKLKHRVDALESDRDRLRSLLQKVEWLKGVQDENETLRADRDRLKATVERVEKWGAKYPQSSSGAEFRAAIADPTTGEGLAKRMGASKVRELTNDQKAMIDRAITGVHSPSAVDVFRALAGDDPTPAPEQTEGADD